MGNLNLEPVALAAPTNHVQMHSPSNVNLFLTNIRLLDLDLRDDWPGITVQTFSTKDAQQNQKARIQCVEWALYRLYEIWDRDEARNVCCDGSYDYDIS